MPELLLELFSEEIPARMQAKAADDLRKLVTDKASLDFTPGSEFSYSNSGYNLAAIIVERVSKQKFPAFVEERLDDGVRDGQFQRDVEHIVNAILEEIVAALSRGDRVELRGFGAFSVKSRPARTGRNHGRGIARDRDQPHGR